MKGLKGKTAIVTGAAIDRNPIFSNDGTHVAFLRESGAVGAGPFELAVVDRGGGGFRVVTTLSARPEFVDWYPDGSAILVNEAGQLTRYDISGNGAPTVIAAGVDVKPGAFRPPEGNQILFELGGPEDSGLYVMNADGTGRRAVLEQAAGTIEGSPNAARWSPDGRMIAFRTNIHQDPEQARLWVINADGSGLRQLDEAAGVWVYNDLRWSPDGTRIAFNRWQMDEASSRWHVAPIGVVSIDGGPVKALGPTPHDDGAAFDWSPDGSAIVSVPGPLAGFPLLTTTARPLEIDSSRDTSRELPWQVNSTTSWQRLAP